MAGGSKYYAGKLNEQVTIWLLSQVAKLGRLTINEIINIVNQRYPDINPSAVRNLAWRLKDKGSLEGNGKFGYTLSDSGLAALESMTLNRLEQTDMWDHRWRIVVFDIPENQRAARDAIRRLIK
jgi:DNA-binding transcriptional regulator PaaX